MEKYRVILTHEASAELIELKNYIAHILKAPDTALRYIRGLRQEIEKLETFPESIAPVDDEPWRSRGIRRKIYKNFYIYYRVEKSEKRVYVLNVIYTRRDQLNALLSFE